MLVDARRSPLPLPCYRRAVEKSGAIFRGQRRFAQGLVPHTLASRDADARRSKLGEPALFLFEDYDGGFKNGIKFEGEPPFDLARRRTHGFRSSA